MFGAMREKFLGIAGRAIRQCGNLPGRHAGVEQLAAVGFLQVKMLFDAQVAVSGSTLVHEQHRVFHLYGVGILDFMKQVRGVGELGFKLGGKFVAHFITTFLDAGANRGVYVLRA